MKGDLIAALVFCIRSVANLTGTTASKVGIIRQMHTITLDGLATTLQRFKGK